MILEYTQRAGDDLFRPPKATASRIVRKMGWYASQDEPLSFAKKLRGTAEETWRFRIGVYRVLCRIKNGELQILTVLTVKHRKDIYKDL